MSQFTFRIEGTVRLDQQGDFNPQGFRTDLKTLVAALADMAHDQLTTLPGRDYSLLEIRTELAQEEPG